MLNPSPRPRGLALAGALPCRLRGSRGQVRAPPAARVPGFPVGAVIVAVILGVIIGQLWTMPAALRNGLHRVVRLVLPAAIMLLGSRLALDELVATGVQALAMVLVLMVTALAVAHLVGRITHTSSVLSTLLGVGVSVCGNTAIIATAPAIGPRTRRSRSRSRSTRCSGCWRS